jgi:hypothetical protein
MSKAYHIVNLEAGDLCPLISNLFYLFTVPEEENNSFREKN